MSRMAKWNRTSRMPAFFSLLALMLLTLLDSSAAATEKKAPSRTFRVRARSSDDRSPVPQSAGMRSVRRFQGSVSNAGESTRRFNYAPLKPIVKNEENKHRASESVHVVSLQSMNPQGKSQPVYRAAVTKLKIPEVDYLMEPKDVSVRVMSSQSVLVTWVDPVHEKSGKVGSNRHYTIRYREKGESARWDYKQINTRRALVDKLNPDAMYEFSVRISQEDQDSQWSSSIFQRTPESAPTSAPENLYVEPLNGKGTAVTATWDELSDSAGKIKEYFLSYAPAMKPFGGKSLPYSGTTTSAIIDGLQPGERYIFKIRAANRRGQGPQSKAFTVTMPVASTATNNLYHRSQMEDFEEAEKTKQEKVPEKNVYSESSEEDILESLLKTNFKDHEDKLPHEKADNIQTSSSEANPKSTEVFDDTETTTLTPKPSTQIPRRRIRPFLNNRFNSNTARRPFRTNSLHLGRRIVDWKPAPPTVVTDEDNETKDSETDETDIYSTTEHQSKDSEEINNESKEVESLNPNYDNLEDVAHKVSQTDSSKRDSGNKMNVHDLQQGKSLPTSPISNPLRKVTTSINNSKDRSKATIVAGSTRSSNLEKLSTYQKSHFTQLPSPTVDEEDKDISENDKKSKSTNAGQSPRKTNDRTSVATLPRQTQSKLAPSSKVDPKQPHSTLLLNKESTYSTQNSTNSDLDSNKGNRDSGLQDFKTKTFKGHPSSKTSNPKIRQHTAVRGAVRTVSTTTVFPTSTTTPTTTATTTPTTTITSTTTTTTTEAQTTSKSYKPNIMLIDSKLSSSTIQPPVPSFTGKSALSILEYYRRRSSKVSSNIGRRITSNGNSKIQPVATTQTTTSYTVMSTTLPPKIVNKFDQDKLLFVPVKKEDPYLSSSEVPSKSSSNAKSRQEIHKKDTKKRILPITSGIQISKKNDDKTSSTELVTSKWKTETYDIPVKMDNFGTKSEQMKTVITSKESRNPYVASHSDEEQEEQPGERKITHNVYKKQNSNLALTSKPTAASRSGSALSIPQLKLSSSQTDTSPSYLPGNKNVGLKKTIVKQGYDSDIEEDNDSQDQTRILTSNRESLPRTGHSSKQRPNYRIPGRISAEGERKFSKPHISSSGVEAPIKYVPGSSSQSEFSTSDNSNVHSIPAKQPEKVENPTPRLRSRLSSYSNVRFLKNRNGKINDSKISLDTTFSQKQSTKLEDEEGLSAPPTLKEISRKSSGLSSSYMNSRQFVIPRRPTTTVPPTTSRPQSSTRTSPYRLLPSISRQQNYGRSSSYRTSPSPTTSPVRAVSPTYSPSLLHQRMLNSSLGSPLRRQLTRPFYRQGNNGRPNLASRFNSNGNTPSRSNDKLNGQRMIYGPEGTKWVVDLNRGLVLNTEGRYLQDSKGKPLRIKLGGDGRTIIDLNGTPVVSPDGLPLFGHGRFSKPVASPQDRPVLSLGGRPLRGLEVARTTRHPTTRITTTPPTTTTTTTTTLPPTTTTTTLEPTTIEQTTEEPLIPTCAPGSYSQYDEEGNLMMGPDDKPDCYSEDSYSGQDLIVTTEAAETVTYLDLDQDYELFETTELPVQTTTIATTTTTEPPILTEESEIKSFDNNLVSEFDAAGKKRFSAPYVSYISKDPNTPCSLTDALEHFQVENLADLIPNEMRYEVLPPQKISYNITIVAVEGCHSFVILDWAKPKKGDYITGYLVYSASYDDFLRNKWSTRTAGGTNFPIENLKPNTRYYFQIQAKNPHGFGPVSPSVSFITESDNPLLIVRPPGGEPIWIPYVFKHDTSYTGCHGKQYVKRTWYRKFVGVVLCNSLRYKIYLSENLRDTFYSIGDSWGRGEDHCQFVDSYMEGRTDPLSEFQTLPAINGYYRQYTQEPVMFGRIGYGTPHNYVSWYECGVPIPGKW